MGFVAAIHERRSFDAGRRAIDAANHKARVLCPCGKCKPAQHLVCYACWQAAPVALRNDYHADDSTKRSAAIKGLTDFAKGRNPETTDKH